jgi:hypothetical protein
MRSSERHDPAGQPTATPKWPGAHTRIDSWVEKREETKRPPLAVLAAYQILDLLRVKPKRLTCFRHRALNLAERKPAIGVVANNSPCPDL